MTRDERSRVRINGRFYRNTAEDQFMKLAAEQAWRVGKRGWPDFVCLSKSGERFVVEVKPFDGERFKPLKAEQGLVFDWLTLLGIRCYVSDGNVMALYSAHTRSALLGGRPVETTQVAGVRISRPKTPAVVQSVKENRKPTDGGNAGENVIPLDSLLTK